MPIFKPTIHTCRILFEHAASITFLLCSNISHASSMLMLYFTLCCRILLLLFNNIVFVSSQLNKNVNEPRSVGVIGERGLFPRASE